MHSAARRSSLWNFETLHFERLDASPLNTSGFILPGLLGFLLRLAGGNRKSVLQFCTQYPERVDPSMLFHTLVFACL